MSKTDQTLKRWNQQRQIQQMIQRLETASLPEATGLAKRPIHPDWAVRVTRADGRYEAAELRAVSGPSALVIYPTKQPHKENFKGFTVSCPPWEWVPIATLAPAYPEDL